MGHLDDASTIPLWISLGIASLFLFVFGIASLWFSIKRRNGKTKHSTHSYIPVYQAMSAFCAMALIIVMDITLILQQTEFIRADGVAVVWGRWAFYIPVFLIISWMISLYHSRYSNKEGDIEDGSYAGMLAVWFSAFGAAALLLATISSGNNIWFWFAIASVLWITTIIMYILCYVWGEKKLKAWLAGIMISVIVIAYLIFLVFWAIGKSGGNVGGFGFAAERWLYVVAEFLLIVYAVTIVFTEGKDVSKVPGFRAIRNRFALDSTGKTKSTV